MKTLYLSGLIICFSMWACDDIKQGPHDHDGTAPGKVTDVQITRLPGGATFTYTLPEDPDFLCVEASYRLADGVEKMLRSSYYSRSVTVEGFADTSEYMVSLTCVDRSENRSEPEIVTFRPMTPPVIGAFQTLKMEADFGGIHLEWQNPGQAALALFITTKDSLGDDKVLDTYYTFSEEGNYTLRGLDTVSIDFTVKFRDKWNNYSDKHTKNLTPIFETLLDRTKYRSLGIDYATEGVGNIGDLPKLWDNDFTNNAITSNKAQVPWSASWDLGVTARLSRIVIWQYAWSGSKNYGHYYYGDNGRHYKVYGTNTLDDPDSWFEIADCEIIKKSGLPIGYGREYMSDEDFDIAHNKGHEFLTPLDIPAVRYLCLRSLEAWNGRLGSPAEIQVYGDPR